MTVAEGDRRVTSTGRGLLQDRELDEIERSWPDGLTSRTVVESQLRRRTKRRVPPSRRRVPSPGVPQTATRCVAAQRLDVGGFVQPIVLGA